ncbi:bZIP transcription factor [Aspergillus saccharolyticus JOP 1030-1]|uniref:BZIP domain-containing protein n=1 Tax=Aspergillus saccharolyticus JOP 1030-1 TaxID=1450539 RepID=A0A318ZK52_9EURO|nr:hypothetical protein BP01DRAFT_389777 [Aspergillus saccharolyticus JOP 1030-1]PYH47886.1 hypothetical protein BP01DRAFT_389777 [Aspergillus saccharolyticus JOP 1030-1]
MSVNMDHSSMPGAPSKSDITWTGPMPFLIESPISSDFLTMPLFDGMQEWSMSGSTPGVPAPSAEGLDSFQRQQQHSHQQTFMNAFSEPNLFSRDQTTPPHLHPQSYPHLAPKDPLLDGTTSSTMHPFAGSPSSYPVSMHELTSRGSISDHSQRSYGSISSISSASSASSAGSAGSSYGHGHGHGLRRPSDLLAQPHQHPYAHSPDREAMEQQKRERFLERNRVAANKCRRKKKEHTRQLESKCMEVTQTNTRLESEVSQLRSQILELKNQLLQHSGCDDPGIKAHLARMVASLSQRSASVVSTGPSEPEVDGAELSSAVSLRGQSGTPLRTTQAEQVDAAAFGFDDMVAMPAAAAAAAASSKGNEGKQEEEDAEVKMKESP